jgi:hypothetical protein
VNRILGTLYVEQCRKVDREDEARSLGFVGRSLTTLTYRVRRTDLVASSWFSDPIFAPSVSCSPSHPSTSSGQELKQSQAVSYVSQVFGRLPRCTNVFRRPGPMTTHRASSGLVVAPQGIAEIWGRVSTPYSRRREGHVVRALMLSKVMTALKHQNYLFNSCGIKAIALDLGSMTFRHR